MLLYSSPAKFLQCDSTWVKNDGLGNSHHSCKRQRDERMCNLQWNSSKLMDGSAALWQNNLWQVLSTQWLKKSLEHDEYSQVQVVMCWTVLNSITVNCRGAFFSLIGEHSCFVTALDIEYLLDFFHSVRKHCTAKAFPSSGMVTAVGIRKQEWETLMVSLANCDELLLLGTRTIKSSSWKNQEQKETRKAENEWTAIAFICFTSVMYLESWHPLQPDKHRKKFIALTRCCWAFIHPSSKNFFIVSLEIEMKNKFSQFCRKKTIFMSLLCCKDLLHIQSVFFLLILMFY